MFSIIVPVYNAEKYLRRCVDSILQQVYVDFELFLIDDGSNDSSGLICDEYAAKDNRVVVFHKENGGASSARNFGINYAKGEWISFVDSDDYVLPTFLKTYIELIGDEVDLCVLGVIPDYSISTEYKIIKTSFNYSGDAKYALTLLNDCQMTGSLSNKIFKKSIIEKNHLRLNENFRYREDEEFLLRYLYHVRKCVATVKKEYVYMVPHLSKYNSVENLPTIMSMYSSAVRIYSSNANDVTDSYQTELYIEILSLLKSDFSKTIKILPKVFKIIGRRIFRYVPFMLACKKICRYFNK